MDSPRCTSGPLTLPAGILVGRSDLAVVHHRMQRAQSDDVVNVAAGAAAHVGVEDELHRRRGARHGGPTEPGGQHSRAEGVAAQLNSAKTARARLGARRASRKLLGVAACLPAAVVGSYQPRKQRCPLANFNPDDILQ